MILSRLDPKRQMDKNNCAITLIRAPGTHHAELALEQLLTANTHLLLFTWKDQEDAMLQELKLKL